MRDEESMPLYGQVPCARCGVTVFLNGSWEQQHAVGEIKIHDDSCLPSHLTGKDVLKDESFMDAPPVVEWGYQTATLKWGENYCLCLDCHHKFLALIGSFFFKPVKGAEEKKKIHADKVAEVRRQG